MNDVSQINPSRLKFARKRRGLTIKALSDKLGLTSRSLSSFENGHRHPSQLSLKELSNALDFPQSFFFLDDIEPINTDAVSFRSLARMSATIRDSALHASQIALEFSDWMSDLFETPPVDLVDLSGCSYSPEVAANLVREKWAMGEKPVGNLIHLLEAKGVKVFSLAEDTHDMDAYSFWRNNTPFIFLNTKKSTERSRFDAAHELGHLLLHKHGSSRGKEAETEANFFASSFLMPGKSVLAYLDGYYQNLAYIIKLKKVWKVSAAALIRRLKDMGLLTDWQYRSLNIDLSSKGYSKKEPDPITERETSKLLPLLFKALKADGISRKDVAAKLGYQVQDLDAVMFNLTMMNVASGNVKRTNQKIASPKGKAQLKRIK